MQFAANGKDHAIAQPTAVQAPISKADDAVLSLARLIGRQAAREMAVLETNPDASPKGGSDEQPPDCASDDAAGFLSVSTRTLKRLVAEGELGAVKIRGSMHFKQEGLEALIDASRCS